MPGCGRKRADSKNTRLHLSGRKAFAQGGLCPHGDQFAGRKDGGACESCHGTGYRGRIAVMELLAMSDALRRLVLKRATAQDIHRCAAEEGMRSMYDDGLRKALRGVTSFEEVVRVTRDI